MLAHPNNHPLNWFPYEMTCSIELLSAYGKDIEAQVTKGIAGYQVNAEIEVVESTRAEESARLITHHLGLDDETWDLRSIFEEYFPNLQRRSALITLLAFFEHALDNLCKRVRIQSGYNIDLSDIGEKGIRRSTTYLLKVAEMDGIRTSSEWHEVKQIQLIRNQIVHSDGKLPGPTDARRARLEDYIAKSNYLEVNGDGEINIMAGYLAHCLTIFESYFSQLHEALRRKYEA